MKTIALDFAASFVALYLAATFIKLDGNLFLWGEHARFMLLVLASMTTAFIQIVRRGQ